MSISGQMALGRGSPRGDIIAHLDERQWLEQVNQKAATKTRETSTVWQPIASRGLD
jgi:hypothetical protein